MVDDNSPEEIVAIDRELPWHRNTSSDAAVSDPHARGERNQSTHDEQSGELVIKVNFPQLVTEPVYREMLSSLFKTAKNLKPEF